MFIALALVISSMTATQTSGQSAVALDFGATRAGDEYDSITLLEVGVRVGSLKPKRVNVDVRLTTFPQALTAGFIALASDLDAAYVLPLGKGTVATPRIGMSLVGGASEEGAGGVPGVNFGVGIVAGLTSPVAVRFDFGRRILLGGGEGLGASSFSIGIVWVH